MFISLCIYNILSFGSKVKLSFVMHSLPQKILTSNVYATVRQVCTMCRSEHCHSDLSKGIHNKNKKHLNDYLIFGSNRNFPDLVADEYPASSLRKGGCDVLTIPQIH